MKRTCKVLAVVIALTILLVINALGVYALQSFTDVGDNHWAKEHIEKMSEKKIITGYPDATFRPSENVDKLATMVMISRTLKATNKLAGIDMNSLVQKYKLILDQYNIPQWGREAVALGLEKNIIDRYDVEDFFKDDGTLEKATRTEVSVLLGKTLNLYLNEELKNTIITFDFNDAEFIPTEASQYIDLLIKKDIIKGDDNGNFNPNKPIVRAAVAKMFSGFYNVLSGIVVDIDTGTNSNDDTNTNIKTNTTEDDEDLVIEKGKIVLVLKNENKIVVSNDDDKNSLYKIENNTKIVIQDKTSSINYLQEGENVKLYIDEYGKLVKVEVSSDIKEFEGTIQSIVDMGSYLLVIVDDEKDNRRTFKADDDTVVLLNEEKSSISSLNRGDNVTLTVDGDTIEEIDAESKTRIYEGILESNVVFNEHLEIRIKTHTQKVYELEVDDDVDVEKNDRSRKVTDLRKGDIVTVKTEYGKVVEIVATSVEVNSEYEGIITEIIIGSEDKISIKDDDGEVNTYVIASGADIEVDDRDSDLSDLKPDYKVTIKVENGIVTDIDAEKVDLSDSMSGVITEIFKDFDAVTVKVKDGSKTKYVSVLAEDAEIISTSGKEKNFSYLDENDEIFIYGKGDHKIFDFVADKIIILKKD